MTEVHYVLLYLTPLMDFDINIKKHCIKKLNRGYGEISDYDMYIVKLL